MRIIRPRSLNVLLALLAIALGETGLCQSSGNAPLLSAKPDAVVQLHSSADWRLSPIVQFDKEGRLLVLYRDKHYPAPQGQWHLIRITNPMATQPKREELAFSPIEESTTNGKYDPQHLTTFRFLLSRDEHFGYFTFRGVAEVKTANDATQTVKNVPSYRSITNIVSFDMTRLAVISRSDFSSQDGTVDTDDDGNLLVWHTVPYVPKQLFLLTFTPELKSKSSTEIDTYEMRSALGCNSNLEIACAGLGSGIPSALMTKAAYEKRNPQWSLGKQLSLYRKVTLASVVNKSERDKRGMLETRIVRLDQNGEEVASEPLPCGTLEKSSSDYVDALVWCQEVWELFDWEFTGLSLNELYIYDSNSLRPFGLIKLSKRQSYDAALWHHDHMAIVATLENGETIRIYKMIASD